MEPEYIEAFRSLCELIHTPTSRKLESGTSVDWSRFPAVAAAVGCGGDPVTPERVGAGMAELLEEAVRELTESYPPNGDRVSPLEVMDEHLIKGYSWEAIVSECTEKGRPISERTLRSRQRDGLEAILEQQRASAPVPARKWSLRAVATGIALLATIWIGWRITEHLSKPDLAPLVGRLTWFQDGETQLRAPFPHLTLPTLEARYVWGMIVEPDPGRYLLIVTTAASGAGAGSVLAVDPQTTEVVWSDRFLPTAEQLGVDTESEARVLQESFRPNSIIYGDSGDNLSDRIVVPYVHRFSHCFVVEYDVRTGAQTGIYHHNGRLETHIFADLDRDGERELVLGGQDNSLNLPVLVVLEPGAIRGAASTIPGTKGEGACARAFLPGIPELQEHWAVDRLQIIDQVSHRWNPSMCVLSFHVGPRNDRPAYRISLTDRLQPTAAMPISVGESPARAWRAAGLDPARADSYADQVQVVGRCDCLAE